MGRVHRRCSVSPPCRAATGESRGRGEGREVADRDSQPAWRRRPLPCAPLLLCLLPPPLKRRSRMVRSQGWPPACASGRRAAVPVAARRSRGRVCHLLLCSVPRQRKGRRRPEDHRSADPRTELLALWIASLDRRRSAPSSRATPAVAANWSRTPRNAKPLLSFARRKPVRRRAPRHLPGASRTPPRAGGAPCQAAATIPFSGPFCLLCPSLVRSNA
jgi:hypothetical protein